ncbi:MAG: dipeptidyl aminopeptidase/acylaminoacyl peptidase [Saprospiraceae bacterium]|jgi:dipeptidyl aminopeptidase/acylaminoacyl peptidase
MTTRLFLLLIISFFVFNNIDAQSKKEMTPDTYLEWNRITSEKISNNGDWVKYHLEAEKGDKTLKIYNTRANKTYTFDRVGNSDIDGESKHVIFMMAPAYDKVRALKRKKVKKEDMPKDTLCIYDLDLKVLTKIPNVKSFKLPKKMKGYMAYLKDAEMPKDSLNKLPKEDDKNGTKLILLNLRTNQSDTLYYATDYQFAEDGLGLAATSTGIDSITAGGVYNYDFGSRNWNNILETKGKISKIIWQEKADKLAFVADRDITEERVRPFELFLWEKNQLIAKKIADRSSNFLPEGYNVSNFSTPRFSKEGNRLMFSIAPSPILQDTSLLDDEIVNVEVWHYNDSKLYTRQENDLKADQENDYSCMYDISKKKFSIVRSTEFDDVIYDEHRSHAFAIGLVTDPYEKYVMWKGHNYFDGYRINLSTGKKEKFITKERGRVRRSPNGKYAMWYNASKKAHFAYNVETNTIKQITSEEIGIFYDELNDRPMDPWDYGYAGYTNDEKYIIMNDRYDIWFIDPDGVEAPQRITNGRETKTKYRYMDFDLEESIIDISSNFLMLHSFNETDKSQAYEHLDLKFNKTRSVHKGDFKLDSRPMKALDSNDYLFTQESYTQFPDLRHTQMLYTNDMDLEHTQISTANPQQKDYNWGDIQLHKWTSLDGVDLSGLLVLPDDFDPKKKYPLIVNFYERSSDGIHNHRAPFAHRSTINYSYYSSKGYVIFNPDIVYRNGYPGQSCYDAVIPGVASVVALGYIDEDRIGVQGHSWGGYQIADLLTKTDIFRCAESGAPVVNMISAYGGIRWGSGRSRMFQYEMTQSRLGATLWEKPELYLENSPIFNLDKVTTPVLIMHNDEDGAVPWYQGIEYFNGLRRLEKPAWFLNYNGEPHWPVKWQNKLDFNIRMEQFFDHYLKDTPMPRWMKRGVPAVEKGIRQGYKLD